MVFQLLRPALFAIDSEKAHRLAVESLKLSPFKQPAKFGALSVKVAGIRFPNPVGVAAGFDKDAEVPDALLGLGFGFTEAGSITPRPQAGNPKPRLFRLVEDRAVINRMGFNNAGSQRALERLERRKGRPGILGINIGANKDSSDRIADYAKMTRLMAPHATYLAVNISSPNTPGLRALQDEAALTDLLDAVVAARAEACVQVVAEDNTKTSPPPIFLKVAPDLEPADVDAIARIALDKELGALIVSNTTISRPELRSHHASETGGLSGKPLCDLALQRVRDFRQATGGSIPLVGVGGISSAEDAWARIKAGASLVQIYSAMVYEGPTLGGRIARGIERLMKRDGFSTIAEAVGTE
ncbi:MAG: quinone-dependent dihydroorotate dehydrogenase [Erythrobacter sp.]